MNECLSHFRYHCNQSFSTMVYTTREAGCLWSSLTAKNILLPAGKLSKEMPPSNSEHIIIHAIIDHDYTSEPVTLGEACHSCVGLALLLRKWATLQHFSVPAAESSLHHNLFSVPLAWLLSLTAWASSPHTKGCLDSITLWRGSPPTHFLPAPPFFLPKIVFSLYHTQYKPDPVNNV